MSDSEGETVSEPACAENEWAQVVSTVAREVHFARDNPDTYWESEQREVLLAERRAARVAYEAAVRADVETALLATYDKHGCCPHPFLRSEDRWGGRTAPTRGQCDCRCHEKDIPRDLVAQRVQASRNYEREAMARAAELDAQIERLATWIVENISGEPSQSEGAVDTVIRVVGLLQRERERVWKRVQFMRRTLPDARLSDAERALNGVISIMEGS